MDHFCYLCFVFVMFSCLLFAALWSPAGKGLTSWLSFVMFIVFLSLCGILGQVWYLIVSIPDLCHLSYFGVRFEILFDFYKKYFTIYMICIIICKEIREIIQKKRQIVKE